MIHSKNIAQMIREVVTFNDGKPQNTLQNQQLVDRVQKITRLYDMQQNPLRVRPIGRTRATGGYQPYQYNITGANKV